MMVGTGAPVLWTVASGVFVLNLPFGFWRASVPTFSFAWFLVVHLPVLGVVALRLLCGLGWYPLTFMVLGAAFFLGQMSGGLMRTYLKSGGG